MALTQSSEKNLPSLSKTAIRWAGGTKLGELSSVTLLTKVVIAERAAVSFQGQWSAADRVTSDRQQYQPRASNFIAFSVNGKSGDAALSGGSPE
jgi:hypothetical protein